MNKYFKAFKEEITWFNYDNEPIEVFEIEDFELTEKFKTLFPCMTTLIEMSAQISVDFKGKSYILFGWDIMGSISGWLCQFDQAEIDLMEEHQVLVDNIGGIVQTFGDVESVVLNGIDYNYTLWLNMDSIFVASLCTTYDQNIELYLIWCKEGNFTPIDLTNKVYFAKEATGAVYFYDKRSKEVLLLSYDHAFNFVEYLPDQPELTLHRLFGIKTFKDYVELLAIQALQNKK